MAGWRESEANVRLDAFDIIGCRGRILFVPNYEAAKWNRAKQEWQTDQRSANLEKVNASFADMEIVLGIRREIRLPVKENFCRQSEIRKSPRKRLAGSFSWAADLMLNFQARIPKIW